MWPLFYPEWERRKGHIRKLTSLFLRAEIIKYLPGTRRVEAVVPVVIPDSCFDTFFALQIGAVGSSVLFQFTMFPGMGARIPIKGCIIFHRFSSKIARLKYKKRSKHKRFAPLIHEDSKYHNFFSRVILTLSLL